MFLRMPAAEGPPWWAIIYCNSSSKDPCLIRLYKQYGEYRMARDNACAGNAVSNSGRPDLQVPVSQATYESFEGGFNNLHE